MNSDRYRRESSVYRAYQQENFDQVELLVSSTSFTNEQADELIKLIEDNRLK